MGFTREEEEVSQIALPPPPPPGRGQWRIYGREQCDTSSPLGAEGALMNGRRPDPLSALPVHTYITASFLAEGVLILEIETFHLLKRLATRTEAPWGQIDL